MFPAWLHKKLITIAGQSGAGTEYQIKLLIGASASATGADFHLEGNSALFPADKGDGGDLRFANSAEDTELSFWVQEVTGSGATAVATVWVKVDSSLDTSQDIYVYYNNGSASNASDGSATFIVFDEFTSYTTDWDITTTGTSPNWVTTQNANDVEVSGTISGNTHSNGQRMYRKTALPAALSSYGGLSVMVKVQRGTSETSGNVNSTSDCRIGFYQSGLGSFGNYANPSQDHISVAMLHRYNDATEGEWYGDARDGATASGSDTGNHHADTDWNVSQVYEFKAMFDSLKMEASSPHHTLTRTGIAAGVFTGMTAPILYLGTSNYRFQSGTTNTDNVWDWVAVRKVQDTEPAFSTAAAEESNASTGVNIIREYHATASGSVGSLTIPNVEVGADEGLIVTSAIRDGGTTVVTVAFNTSEGLTEEIQNNGDWQTSIHSHNNPTDTTANIVVTYSASRDRPRIASAYVVAGHDLTDIVEAVSNPVDNFDGTTPKNANITTLTDGALIIDILAAVSDGTNPTITPSGGQTELDNREVQGTFGLRAGQSSKTLETAGATTMGWAISPALQNQSVAVAIKPASGGGGPTPSVHAGNFFLLTV